ncbi:MAG: magnesium transporter [Planctomycetes bacterium]|nr:magnesium transporter [Planctomycetota bacterium]
MSENDPYQSTGQREDEPLPRVAAADLRDAWPVLDAEARIEGFRYLTSSDAEEFFLELPAFDRATIVTGLPTAEQRWWIRALPPDDVADVIQEINEEDRSRVLSLLDDSSRREISALLAYSEDEAGGLMNPRYARLRPDMSVDEAISYLRRQTRERVESIYYAYVLDQQAHLLGVVSFRQLMMTRGDALVRDVMETDLIRVPEEMDQEALSALFAQHDFLSLPVVDANGCMKGIVTADDIVDVVREEATEDIQKIGGTAALEAPYLQVGMFDMLKKRGGWLVLLFVGEMATEGAMSHFGVAIEKAAILAFFIPLIISSGGNCGSQASTLVIRAIALGEVRLRDWWRVFARELAVGTSLGLLLGIVGFVRIMVWQNTFKNADDPTVGFYGEHWALLGATVGFSVLGVALWGTLSGALLPFALKRFGLDPATASAPLVATMVDVTGLVIYFTTAAILLHGTLL